MLGSLAASKTAKLIATCACPVVGAGTLTMAVPKVRNTVHNATAPREYAMPKIRERAPEPAAAIAPCTTIGATPLSAGFIEEMPITGYPSFGGDVPETPIHSVVLTGPGSHEPVPGSPGGPGSPGSGGVPEPQIWLQLLAGFTLVGGAVRMARKRPTEDEEVLLDRLDSLKKDARQ